MLGSPILCLKGMRIMMFQLSGFYYRKNALWKKAPGDDSTSTGNAGGKGRGVDSRFWLICGVGLGCTVEAQKLETL